MIALLHRRPNRPYEPWDRPARRCRKFTTVGWFWLQRDVSIKESIFPVSELETLKSEIRSVSIQLFSRRSAVDGGEKLIRVYHSNGYIDIRQETIEQPQWQQLDDFINRIIKRFFPSPESFQMPAAPDPSARSVGLV